MQKILFPTDFSQAAGRAFRYALRLADAFKAEVITLHAFETPDITDVHLNSDIREFYDNMDLYEFESYRDAIPPLVQTAEAEGFGHITMKHVLRQGDAESVILEVAQTDAIDMIVMGTTGARGLKEIFMGSIAGEVLENAPCPVLAVPEQATFDGTIDHIAFATRFAKEDEVALQQLQQLFAPFQPNIHAINVDLAHTEQYTHRKDAFAAAFTDHSRLSFEVLDGTDIYETITDYLSKHNIDILAMVTHRRNFFQELFHFSRTKQMAYHVDTPVLALKVSPLTS